MPMDLPFEFVPSWPDMEPGLPKELQDPSALEMLHRRDRSLEDYLANLSSGGKEYATVVVAASDTHTSGKAAADFVATGTDDYLTLQAAIDSLPSVGGFSLGKIVLLEGTFVGTGDVVLGNAVIKIQGQGQGTSGIGVTNTFGINLTSTGTSVVEVQDVLWIGDMTSMYALALVDVTMSGDLDASQVTTNNVYHLGDLHFTSGASLNSHKGAPTAGGDAVHGTVGFGSMFRMSDVVLTVPVNAECSPAGSGVLDLDQVQMLSTAAGLDADIILDGFGGGQADLQFTADGAGTLLKLIDCANLRVRGMARPVGGPGTAGPQVLIESTGDSPADNVAVEYFHFVGNVDGSGGPGITTYHIEVGTGVTGTKLVYNYYGGADTGDVLDNGTDTVQVAAGSGSTAPLTEGDEAGLFWMQSAVAGPAGATGATGATGAAGAAADEGLLWMFGGSGPKGDTGATGAAGATGASADEALLWMQAAAAGPAGPAGAAGATGAAADEALLWMQTGTPGPAGPVGATGATGAAGASGAVPTVLARRTAGTVTLTSTSYTDISSALDLVLPAVVGDMIEVGILGVLGAENNSANLEFFSLVAGSVVNPWSSSGGSSSYTGWYKPITSLAFPIGGSVMKTVVSGDLSGGNVTLRLRGRRDGATNVTVFGTTDIPLNVWAKNHGTGTVVAAADEALIWMQAGTPGPAGATGATGSAGATGATGAQGASGPIGLCQYNPASNSSFTTTSTSYADVDATNLVVTFTAPASGSVLVRLSALTQSPAATGANNQWWNLRSGASSVTDSDMYISNLNGSAHRAHGSVVMSGLTPGASYTWKWGWKIAAAGTATIYVGRTAVTPQGPAVMEVYDTSGAANAVPLGTLLGRVEYDPVALATYSSTSTSIADIDATNVLVTFTAPASGNVLVTLEGVGRVNTSTTNVDMQWGVREGSTTVGSLRRVLSGSEIRQVRMVCTFLITGVSAGSHTYKWGFARAAGTAGAAQVFAGGVGAPGPVFMTVYAA